MSDPDAGVGSRRYADLEAFAGRRVAALQRGYLNNESGSVASLARLRRAITAEPGADPTIWGETLEGIPEQYGGRDTASPAERAVHAALCLYALHQQGQRQPQQKMHRAGPENRFGHAIARLSGRSATSDPSDSATRSTSQNTEKAVRRRFETLATASSFSETLHHARGLISQLRAAGIPLDYGRFAVDLTLLQSLGSADRVRLTWGRDYYSRSTKTEDASEATTETGAEE